MSFTIEPAAASDLPAIRRLLEEAALPSSDLADDTSVRFWVARQGDVIGAVGLESFGATALLRSLVVAPKARGSGLGSQLVQALENTATACGTRQLVLLTQTAEAFFAQHGYVVVDRAKVPNELRESTEFKALCPASATCMSRSLVGVS